MIKAITSVFLSFAVISAPSMPMENSVGSTFDPENIIIGQEYEVDMYMNFFVGRHTVIKINSYDYEGVMPVRYYSDFYSARPFEDFHMSQKFSATTTTSISTSIETSSAVNTGLTVLAGFEGASVSKNLSVEFVYTINSMRTYTTSVVGEFQIDYVAKKEYLTKDFAIGQIATVYSLDCQTWQWDDYWWGDYVVSGSEKTFTAYIVIDPKVTIIYMDGTFVD